MDDIHEFRIGAERGCQVAVYSPIGALIGYAITAYYSGQPKTAVYVSLLVGLGIAALVYIYSPGVTSVRLRPSSGELAIKVNGRVMEFQAVDLGYRIEDARDHHFRRRLYDLRERPAYEFGRWIRIYAKDEGCVLQIEEHIRKTEFLEDWVKRELRKIP